MKKLFKVVLIIIILFNFIFCNYFVYADNDEITYSYEQYNQMAQEGTANLGNDEIDLSVSTSTTGSASGTIASSVTPWFMGLQSLLTSIAEDGGITGGTGYTSLDSSAYNTGMFTVCSLVFGEYLLFNVNINQTNASLNSNASTTTISDMIDELKETVAGWFYIIRLVAIAFMLVLIIYSAIRLALSTLSEDKAKYKEVISAWAGGIIFILFLPLIISVFNNLIEVVEDILWSIRYAIENNGYTSFEYGLLVECINGFDNASGMALLAYAIEYIAFLVIEFLFFAKYFIRLCKVLFLTMMAPLIAIMDIFSRIQGSSGNIMNWAKQYLECLLMQPIHALLYLIFMFVANGIALSAPLVGAIFLWALLRGEKIARIILNINYGNVFSIFKKVG